MKPNTKLRLKLLLDVVMLVVLMLLFNKRSLGMQFHEVAGLALLGAFAFHIALNYKWVIGVTRRLFARETPMKTRLGYIIDALLFIAFVLIGVSGMFISKIVFSFHGANVWKTVHYFAAACALALMGVHLGLHITMIRNTLCRKLIPLWGKAVAALCAVALIGYGCYNLATTAYLRWLTMPFTVSAMRQAEGEEHSAQGQGKGPGKGQGKGQGQGNGQGKGQGEGNGKGKDDGRGGQLSPMTAALTLAQFFSIAFIFAGVTYSVELVAARVKKAE